jgi:transcription elongation factor Elf1
MKYFQCPHCGKQLINQNAYYAMGNENEFWCDDCGKIFIIEANGEIIEEDDQ